MAFVDQGEFEAMKTLSGWEAARYDEHRFRAKIKVSAWAVFELSLFDKWSGQWEKWHFHDYSVLPAGQFSSYHCLTSGLNNEKNGTFMTAHFCV